MAFWRLESLLITSILLSLAKGQQASHSGNDYWLLPANYLGGGAHPSQNQVRNAGQTITVQWQTKQSPVSIELWQSKCIKNNYANFASRVGVYPDADKTTAIRLPDDTLDLSFCDIFWLRLFSGDKWLADTVAFNISKSQVSQTSTPVFTQFISTKSTQLISQSTTRSISQGSSTQSSKSSSGPVTSTRSSERESSASATPSSHGLDGAAQVGIGVGVGLGGSILLALAGLIYALRRRRRRPGRLEVAPTPSQDAFHKPELEGSGFFAANNHQRLPVERSPVFEMGGQESK